MNNKRPASDTPRLTAARILANWLSAGRFPDREIASVPQHRAFVTEVVYGVVRHHRTLTYMRERLAMRRPAAPIEAVLLVGLYELFFLDDTDEFATVHEAVESARALGGRASASFANAILRRAQREKDAIKSAIAHAAPGVRVSHPDLLLHRWQDHFGIDKAAALCTWNNTRPSTALTVLRRRGTLDHLATLCTAAGIETSPHPARPADSLVLARGAAVENVPGFSAGLFAVQDPSTLGAIDLLDPQPGETILDACASPGGKTAAIWDRLNGQGRVLACDTHEDRIARLRENVDRLELDGVQILLTDATNRSRLEATLREAGTPSPHAILLDVPCSNTGVLRRRVDARWRFSETRLVQLMELQARMLLIAANFVEPGGRMVYSTCSLEPEENERQVQRFLAGHPQFALKAERRSFPPDSGMDGAYAALLVRTS